MIDGERIVTGCVATAMAQIMYYHKWPKQTTKVIPAYTTETNEIPMPEIGITTIDWDILTSTYSSASSEQEKEMVATLMRLCGSAVEMDYCLDISNSFSEMVTTAFVNYFGYNSIGLSLEERSNYINTVWNQMIYDELKDGRPVFYDGCDSDGGHAFVIDGYDCDDYFHVNWGWGGSQDNYFLLTALNTEYGSFNLNQHAIIGLDFGEKQTILPYAVLNDGILTFYYDNKHGSRTGVLLNWDCQFWDSEYKKQVTSAVFDPSCAEYKILYSTSSMFEDFSNLVSVQGLEYLVTENVTNMSRMFFGCSSLTSLDVSNFDTQNVTYMGWMFGGCSSLTSLDVSNFDTKNVISMEGMFYNCSSLKSLDVSNFDTQDVISMEWMFGDCGSLTSLDVSNFSTQNVTDMKWMFYNCSSLHTLYAGDDWDTSNVTESEDMFDECYELVGQAGTKYSDDHKDQEYARTDGGMESPGYFTYKAPVLRGDANGDGEIGMPDVMYIIQYILNGKFPDE